MKRLLSFRGIIESADNAITGNQNIFTYQSPDLTRAWKVVSFNLFPKTVRASGKSDGQFMVCASLATDEIELGEFAPICDVSDNRQIGWMQKGYNMRDSPAGDFIERKRVVE